MGDALGHLVGARRVEAVWAILIDELARYGFDRLIYGFTRFRTGNGLGHRDDMLVLTNHKNEYVQGFFGEEMFLNAPMTQWAVANEGAKSWSYLESIRDRMTPAQRAIVARRREDQSDVPGGTSQDHYPAPPERFAAPVQATASGSRMGWRWQDDAGHRHHTGIEARHRGETPAERTRGSQRGYHSPGGDEGVASETDFCNGYMALFS